MGLRQACNFKPCTELGWCQLVGIGRIEIGMNFYPLNMKQPDRLALLWMNTQKLNLFPRAPTLYWPQNYSQAHAGASAARA